MKKRVSYHPEPIDTSSVELSEKLVCLTELLAKNVHDHWAVGKIRDGWQFGNRLDDKEKTTPLLVPYEELSDDQKIYDRTTAMETVKAIVRLGYTISEKKEED